MPNTWNPGGEALTPLTIDNSAYYSVILNGVFQSQAVVNILWYRVGIDVVPGDFNLFGAEHLANCVYELVWKSGMKIAQSTLYKLQDITVIPYNGLFDPVYNLPFIREVNEFGQQGGGTIGVAGCLTCRFVLEPQVLLINGFFPPRRGYLSYGPIREIDIDDQGKLSTAAESFYETNLQPVANDLSLLPYPISYYPIRMRITRVLGVPVLNGWTDIQSVDVRPISTFRRSRVPEA